MNINRRDFILCASSLAVTNTFAHPIRGALGNGDNRFIEPAIPSSTEYIQTGLIHMWDGIENVGLGVHDSTATMWKDLVGNIDLSAKVGVLGWSIDHTMLSKSSGVKPNGWYAEVSNQNNSFGEKFVEIVFRFRGSPSSTYDTIYNNGGSNTTRKRQQALVNNGTLAFGISNYDTLDITDCYNAKKSMSIPVQNTSSTAANRWFFCGQLVSTPSGTSFTNGSPAYLRLGGGWYGMNGDIYCVRFYSRVLTAEEVVYNYQIDKERFGL